MSPPTSSFAAGLGEMRPLREIEVISPVFYQLSRAYWSPPARRGLDLPIAIAFATPLGVLVDAVMLSVADVSIPFSFTRSYFHVDLEALSDALCSCTDHASQAFSELFTCRRAKQARQSASARFSLISATSDVSCAHPASAARHGLLHVENADVIFKVIATRFPAVKNVRREEVMAKYACFPS
jgi:isocitrate dehydrogenase kinase/phosphatase